MARKKKPEAEPGSNTNAAILNYVKRLETLEAQKEALAADISVVTTQAKNEGFNVALIKRLVKDRKDEEAARARESEYALYCAAVQLSLFSEAA